MTASNRFDGVRCSCQARRRALRRRSGSRIARARAASGSDPANSRGDESAQCQPLDATRPSSLRGEDRVDKLRRNCPCAGRRSRRQRKPRGLQRILSAMRHQAAADEGERRQRDRTGPVRPSCRRYRRRCLRAGIAPLCRSAARLRVPHSIAISAPRSGWRGTMIVSRSAIAGRSASCAGRTRFVFAGMRAGGERTRAARRWRLSSSAELGFIGGQGRRIRLQASRSRAHRARRARGSASATSLVLRQADVECAQAALRRRLGARAPAVERSRRHAAH